MNKHTRQREAVYAALCSTHFHPTAAEVYEQVRSSLPIGIATVYRTLNMLCKTGQALSLQDENGVIHYDGCVKPHNHIYCSKCRRVLDIDVDISVDCADGRYNVDGYSVMLYGSCKKCE